jgi:hypothetical protein
MIDDTAENKASDEILRRCRAGGSMAMRAGVTNPVGSMPPQKACVVTDLNRWSQPPLYQGDTWTEILEAMDRDGITGEPEPEPASAASGRVMTSRYPGTCSACSGHFSKGTLINYDKHGARGQKASHVDCEAADTAGDSGLVYVEGESRPFVRTRHGLRGGYEHTGVRCEDAPCCGCC